MLAGAVPGNIPGTHPGAVASAVDTGAPRRPAIMSADGVIRVATVQQAAETGVSVEVHEGEEPPRGADVLHRADYREQKQSILDIIIPTETRVAK